MIENLHISWKMIGLIFAVLCMISAVTRRLRRQPEAAGTVVVAHPSLSGRIGGHLISHAIISTITGILGFNVILALLFIVCAIPIWMAGGEVHLPKFTVSWMNSFVAKVKETFADKKDAIADKLHRGKEALGRKFHGDDDDEEEFVSDVPLDSDEFWGGPWIDSASAEMCFEERRAFDARPPEEKIAIFDAATLWTKALPPHFPDIYAPVEWYWIRVGRSTSEMRTRENIEFYKMMWAADQHHAHAMDAKIRAHFTRLSMPVEKCSFKACLENFEKTTGGRAVCNIQCRPETEAAFAKGSESI